jgi:hypothetical protein
MRNKETGMTAMAHVTFDTLKFVETLTKSGMPEAQAKALLEAQQEVLAEAHDTSLATKLDIRHLEKRIDKIEVEIKFLKWMNSIIIAGIGALILKTFF